MMIKHLYVHVPFCRNICYYCDFARTVYNEANVDKWLDVLETESRDIDTGDEKFETIYIGGGTPSSLNCAQLERLLSILKPFTACVSEYSFEANPESLDAEKIAVLARYGINRVSMGVQSTDSSLLKLMNRKHDLEDVRKRVKELRESGVYNISVDLIYSLPTQTIDQLKKSIDDLLELDITHISLYSLTIEENSVFGRKGLKSLDPDSEADMYEYIEQRLEKAGFFHYEVANFAKPGFESRHNLGYWNYDDFRGISCGASSKIGNRRYTVTSDLNSYLTEPHSYDEDIRLSKEELMFEHLMMSLRKAEGLDIVDFNTRYDTDIFDIYKDALSKNKGVLRNLDGHLVCTRLELLNEILIDFMD